MSLHDRWYDVNGRVVLIESDCQHLRTQMLVWIQDDSSMGYGDWRNILEYDSYDGKRQKQKFRKIKELRVEDVYYDKEVKRNDNPYALPF